MVPRVTSKGCSFKGAGAYFLHDLGKAKTAERVAFTHTVNLLTDDPDKAIKVMAWTAAHAEELKQLAGQKATGRKAQNPVYTYVLAWSPDQDPSSAHMVAFGMRSLERLNLAEHEALFVAHSDTDHKHLHVIVNRVHPVTGVMAKMSHDHLQLSRLAQEYEQETGHIYCHERVRNNRARALGDYVQADKAPRLMGREDYQARRHERIAAQRAAAKLHAHKQAAEQRKEAQARDLKAAFDTQAANDDGQYRAREIALPPQEERQAASAAWEEERRAARQRGAEEKTRQALALKEERRRAFLDHKRAEKWTDYEAQQWQALNDKQTAKREALHERQADARARHEVRLECKYAQTEALIMRKIETLAGDLERRGLRGLVERVSGVRARKSAQLEAMKAALADAGRKKAEEMASLVRKQGEQREKQAARQQAERERLAVRLSVTKARQDARFEQQEKQQARRVAQNPMSDPRMVRDLEAQREALREDIAVVSQAREERAREAWQLGTSFGQAAGLGLGLSRD